MVSFNCMASDLALASDLLSISIGIFHICSSVVCGGGGWRWWRQKTAAVTVFCGGGFGNVDDNSDNDNDGDMKVVMVDGDYNIDMVDVPWRRYTETLWNIFSASIACIRFDLKNKKQLLETHGLTVYTVSHTSIYKPTGYICLLYNVEGSVCMRLLLFNVRLRDISICYTIWNVDTFNYILIWCIMFYAPYPFFLRFHLNKYRPDFSVMFALYIAFRGFWMLNSISIEHAEYTGIR